MNEDFVEHQKTGTFPSPMSAVNVSIVIPVWRSAAVLKGCLESCAVQTYKDFEVIVVDNNSPDNSVEVAQSFREALRLRVIRLNANQGYAGGCNVGLDASGAEFALILNSDAELHPEYLQNAVDRFRSERGAAAICGPIYDLAESGRTTSVQSRGQYIGIYLRFLPYSQRLERDGMRVFAPGSPVLMIRRSALDDIRLSNGDYYDSVFGSYGEDIDLVLRLNARGWESVFVAKCISWHVGTVSLGGARRVWQKSVAMQRMVVRNKYLVFYGTLPAPVVALESPWFWLGDLASMMLCAVRQPSAIAAFALAKWDCIRFFRYIRWKRGETGRLRTVGWLPLYAHILRERLRSLV